MNQTFALNLQTQKITQMNKKNILIALTFLSIGTAWAEELPKDTMKVVDIEEVVVIAAPKENRKLRELPAAVTLLSHQDMLVNQVKSVKSLTGIVPNIFIPDYGSKLTSAIYIRGIGSRTNTPSVGMYVDNIPFIEKSAFDFNYSDIERIDILRGPQGTLYGRNTMAGLIKIHTKSPFTYQGTDLRLDAATNNDYSASLTHYHRLSDQFAFSFGGFYEYTGGFFKNLARNNERIDVGNASGGRFRAIYLPTNRLKVDLNVNYEYSDQGGYPYFYTGITQDGLAQGKKETRADYIGKIAYNEKSGYYRNLLNSGVNVEYQADHFILSAVTGFQFLKDRMHMDQDFTEKELFSLTQKQYSKTLSEEITFKSKPSARWQWTTGFSGLYQWLKTQAPVGFYRDNMASMESGINHVFPDLSSQGITMGLDLPNEMNIAGDFKTPVFNAAVYHQSTLKDVFVKGLSVTAGFRVDYEKNSIDYRTGTELPFKFAIRPMEILQPVQTHTLMKGKYSDDYVQLLPKFALQYDFGSRSNVYFTASKGFRSGGYNFQMFSELLQNNLTNDMQSDLKNALVANPKVPEMAKKMIAQYLKPGENITDTKQFILYKPEYTWSYEVGSHLNLFNGKLQADLAAFYMDTRDQQIAKFADSGMGRLTVNAGKSRSYGAEVALRTNLTDEFSLNASYGYTYATFTDYVSNEKARDMNTGKLATVDVSYNGKYVPFVPKHTMNLGAQYVFFINPGHILDKIQMNVNYAGAGRVYWTEKNDVSQAFYGTLNGSLTLAKGNGAVTFWVRNALDKEYASFYFETMQKGFMQKGKPLQAGINIRCKF